MVNQYHCMTQHEFKCRILRTSFALEHRLPWQNYTKRKFLTAYLAVSIWAYHFLSCYINVFLKSFMNRIRLHNPDSQSSTDNTYASSRRKTVFTIHVLTFLTLSSSTGLVCCRRNKALVILQNFTRALLEIGGQRHRIEQLITLGPAMFGGVLPPVECHVPEGLGTKTRFQYVG